MATCNLKTIPVSATVLLGNIQVSTPNVISVNVSRTRGQLVSKASATFQFQGEFEGQAGAPMAVYFDNSIVFVGTIKSLTTSPSFICAGEIIVRVSAEDILHKLIGKAITRRQKLAGLGPIAKITSIYKRTELGYDDPPNRYDVSHGSSPIEIHTPTLNFREMTKLMMGTESIKGPHHPLTAIADPITDKGQGSLGGGGGFILHDHTTLDISGPHAGGPARAVFGIK